jgi:hypothetical protein
VGAGILFASSVAIFGPFRTTSEPARPGTPRPASSNALTTVIATETGSSLQITSTPAGAEVFEGATLLGLTPLRIRIQPAMGTPRTRTFTLQKPGYQPATMEQGPLASDSEAQVVLVAEAPAAPRSTPSVGRTAAPPAGKRPRRTDPPAEPAGEIFMQR